MLQSKAVHTLTTSHETRPSGSVAGGALTHFSFSSKCNTQQVTKNVQCWVKTLTYIRKKKSPRSRYIHDMSHTWLCTIFTRGHVFFILECLVEEQLRVTATKWTVLVPSVTSHRSSKPNPAPTLPPPRVTANTCCSVHAHQESMMLLYMVNRKKSSYTHGAC